MDKLPIRHHELLNHINAEGFTPLHSACKNNNAEIVKVYAIIFLLLKILSVFVDFFVNRLVILFVLSFLFH